MEFESNQDVSSALELDGEGLGRRKIRINKKKARKATRGECAILKKEKNITQVLLIHARRSKNWKMPGGFLNLRETT